MVVTGFFLFVACSILGWIWEVFLNIVMCGTFVNRGILYGPWLPIYGVGAVMVWLISMHVNDAWKIFVISAASCGILEYGTSFFMEAIWRMRWWNYSGGLNINGRTHLLVLIIFGCIGLLFYYVVLPHMAWIQAKLVLPSRMVVFVLLIIILIDFVYAQIHPNVASISTHHPS